MHEREIIAKKRQTKKEKKKRKTSEAEEQGDSGVDIAKESAESDKEQDNGLDSSVSFFEIEDFLIILTCKVLLAKHQGP